jgi:flavin reductase (DIM6/NTAB) family NADH-FMN oxidoreductase RutF
MHMLSSALSPREAYAWLTSLVVPRPIAWISTRDDDGHVNLAPFSYFNALGSDPPMVTVSFAARRDGRDKDTLRLLKKTGQCCINIVEEADLDRMNATSAELPDDESEAERFGIAVVPCQSIAGVRIASARAALECTLVDVHRYGRAQVASLAVLEVAALFVDDALVDEQRRPRSSLLQPVGRLAGSTYAMLGERIERERPPARSVDR